MKILSLLLNSCNSFRIPTMFPLIIRNKSLLFPPYRCSSPSSQLQSFLIRSPPSSNFSSSSSSSSSSSHPQPPRKQFEKDNVRVWVWWSFDNCGVPSGFSVWKIAPSIRRAVRANGIKGPIAFRAYGDVSQFSKFQRIALLLTGIHLRHVTPGGKRNAHGRLLMDLLHWSFRNPPPIHLFLISGDGDLSDYGLLVLHRFKMRLFNILVACPEQASDATCSVATILWSWSSILEGKDLNGKYLNYAPDGPFDSWYGDSKVPLENPFSATMEPTSLQNA